MWFISFFILFVGCAGLPSVQQADPTSIGVGTAIGAGATKAIEKVQEELKPHFPLYFSPIEICSLEKPDTVFCTLVPCSEKVCSITYNKEEWLANNPKVLTVKRSLLVPVTKFCEKKPKECVKRSARYEGKTIVMEE